MESTTTTNVTLPTLPDDVFDILVKHVDWKTWIALSHTCKDLRKRVISRRHLTKGIDLEEHQPHGPFSIECEDDYQQIVSALEVPLSQHALSYTRLILTNVHLVLEDAAESYRNFQYLHLALTRRTAKVLFEPNLDPLLQRRMTDLVQHHLEGVHLYRTRIRQESQVVTLSQIPKIFLWECKVATSLVKLGDANARTNTLVIKGDEPYMFRDRVPVPPLPVLDINLELYEIQRMDAKPGKQWTLSGQATCTEDEKLLISQFRGHLIFQDLYDSPWMSDDRLPEQLVTERVTWIGDFAKYGYLMNRDRVTLPVAPIVHLHTKHKIVDTIRVMPALRTLCIEDGWLQQTPMDRLAVYFPRLEKFQVYVAAMFWPRKEGQAYEEDTVQMDGSDAIHAIPIDDDDLEDEDLSDGDDCQDNDLSDVDDSEADEPYHYDWKKTRNMTHLRRIGVRFQARRPMAKKFMDFPSDPVPEVYINISEMQHLHTVTLMLGNSKFIALQDNPQLEHVTVSNITFVNVVANNPRLRKIRVLHRRRITQTHLIEHMSKNITIEHALLKYKEFEERVSPARHFPESL